MTDAKRKEVLELLLKNCNPGRIIDENLPQYLYKYRSGNNWDLDALENDLVWMGSATKMDDPLDSKVLLTNGFKAQIDYVVNNVEHFKDEKYRVHLNDNSIQKDCFLCSFSEIGDSEDMWERYANSEQGFCIEYDAKTFSCLSKQELIFTNFLIKNKVGVNGEDWYSQREWRIIGFRKNLEINETEDNGKCIQFIKPTRIILGRHVLDNVRMRILNLRTKEGNEEVIIEQR